MKRGLDVSFVRRSVRRARVGLRPGRFGLASPARINGILATRPPSLRLSVSLAHRAARSALGAHCWRPVNEGSARAKAVPVSCAARNGKRVRHSRPARVTARNARGGRPLARIPPRPVNLAAGSRGERRQFARIPAQESRKSLVCARVCVRRGSATGKRSGPRVWPGAGPDLDARPIG